MAQYLSRSTCLIFVLLFVSYEVLICTEGRSLREISNIESASVKGTTTPRPRQRQLQLESSSEKNLEAFRPTTPGHSPGVGHSVNN
ncbi:hypothetical protein SESBI_15386 [Sesbania bispinosa]|nr:hypothetical protein SESBI_15386 [Sesbania bispinosa]